MTARKIKPIGVSPGAPDFVAVARAYGMAATHLTALMTYKKRYNKRIATAARCCCKWMKGGLLEIEK